MRIQTQVTLAAALLLWAPVSAMADTGASAFTLTVKVAHSCKVSVKANVNFNTYSFSSGNQAVGELDVKCTLDSKYSIELDQGSNGAGPTQRRMKHTTGPDLLAYGLYQNEGLSIPWTTKSGGNARSGTGTGVSQQVMVYADLPAGQTVAPGNYTDMVIVTVSVDAVQ